MPRRRDSGYFASERPFPVQQIQDAQPGQRPQSQVPMRRKQSHHFRALERLPIRAVRRIASVGKDGAGAAAGLVPQIPAHMIKVQVTEKDDVNVLRADPYGAEFLRQPPAHAPGHRLNGMGVAGNAAQPGVHQNDLPLRPYQIALEMRQKMFRPAEPPGIPALIRRPSPGRHLGKHIPQRQRSLVVIQRQNFHLAHG